MSIVIRFRLPDIHTDVAAMTTFATLCLLFIESEARVLRIELTRLDLALHRFDTGYEDACSLV